MTDIVRRALIRGRVQGVSYRDWACGAARALGVSGWVRNLADGRVELLAAGPEAAVEELLSQCREGPPAARVAEVDATPEAVGRMPDGAPLDGFRRA